MVAMLMAFSRNSSLPVVQQRRQQPLQLRLLSGIQSPQKILSASAAVMKHMAALHQKPQRALRHETAMPLAPFVRLQAKMPAALPAFQIINGTLIFALITMLFFHNSFLHNY